MSYTPVVLFIVNLLMQLMDQVPWLTSQLWLKVLIGFVTIVVAAYLIYLGVRYVAIHLFSMLARRTATEWDDRMLERRVLHWICYLVPAGIVLHYTPELLPNVESIIQRIIVVITKVFMVYVMVRAVNGFLLASHDVYRMRPLSAERPLLPVVQLVQIIVYFIGGLAMVALIFGQSMSSLFLGLGAVAAVLMLIFQDIILGFVASIQVSSTHMVKPGDWIEMPSRGADGTVLEILINTVKVQNWDNTITTFPTYALIKEDFKNYKGLDEFGGRHIERPLLIDVDTITVCSDERIQELVDRFPLLAEFRANQQLAEPAYPGAPIKGQPVTNLTLFRNYTVQYLRNHPDIVSDKTIAVRLREQTNKGLPLQLFCYVTHTGMVNFDGVQSAIFEHLYGSLPIFGLRSYQDARRMPVIDEVPAVPTQPEK